MFQASHLGVGFVPVFLSLSGLDCASAVLIAATPLPSDESPPLSVGEIVISGDLATPASPPVFDDSPSAERLGAAVLEGCGGVNFALMLLISFFSLERQLGFRWTVPSEGPCMVVGSNV